MTFAERQAAVVQALEQVKAEMVQNMAKYGRNASFRSVASLHVEPHDNGAALYGSANWETMQTGSRGYVAPAAIFDWSMYKGLSFATERERWSFSYAVAYNVRLFGTRLFQSGKEQDIWTTAVERATRDLAKKLVEHTKMEVSQITQKL